MVRSEPLLPPWTISLMEGAERIAPRLLGMRLETEIGGDVTVGRIVEVEAYVGPDDPASHAAARIGKTARNASMFGPPGRAYVYRSYGLHWCLNVVCAAEGDPQGVLLRAIQPLTGAEVMERRRGGARPLGSGPGRLCAALGVDRSLDGHDLTSPPLRLLPAPTPPEEPIGVSPRIGIRVGTERLLRFYLRGNPHVSRSPR